MANRRTQKRTRKRKTRRRRGGTNASASTATKRGRNFEMENLVAQLGRQNLQNIDPVDAYHKAYIQILKNRHIEEETFDKVFELLNTKCKQTIGPARFYHLLHAITKDMYSVFDAENQKELEGALEIFKGKNTKEKINDFADEMIPQLLVIIRNARVPYMNDQVEAIPNVDDKQLERTAQTLKESTDDQIIEILDVPVRKLPKKLRIPGY